MSEEFEVDKIAKKKNKELERAMKLRSNEDLIDSVNRISAMEFEQENPVKVKIKKKPKPDKKTINPGRAGKGNFNVGGSVKKVDGFPDHSGDGTISQKDILMEKGVIPKEVKLELEYLPHYLRDSVREALSDLNNKIATCPI